MKFQMKIPSTCLKYTNILRVTTTVADNRAIGDRNPAVFIKSKYDYINPKLCGVKSVVVYVNEKEDFQVELSPGSWIDFEFIQVRTNLKLIKNAI